MYCMLKALIELLVMTVLFAVCDLPGIKKYIFAVAFSILIIIVKRKERWEARHLVYISLPILTYLMTGIIGSLISVNIYTNTLKIILFWLIPLIFSFSLYLYRGVNISKIIDIQLFASCLAYIMNNGRFIMKFFCVESTFAFSFGAFFLYYVYKKRWGLCSIAALFMYMTDKRISILAVAAALLVLVITKLFRNDKRIAYFIWILVTAAVNGYIWIICSGTLEKFCKAIGIDTSGRVKIYRQIVEWFDAPVLFTGQGLGIVEIILDIWNIKSFSNLHNDLLKFYIELGVIGLLIFLISYGVMFFLIGKRFGNDKMCFILSMTIYSIILFATDNVSIYILYLIPLYSIQLAVLTDQKTGKYKKDVKC